MARSEARISVAIWRDQDYRALSFGAQWMYECLVSQSDLSYAGVLALRESRWSRYASELTSERVESFLGELARRWYVVVDQETGEVLVRSFMRHDEVWKQPNVLRAAQRAIGDIESPAILSALVPEVERMAAMEGITQRVSEVLAEMLETLHQRLKATPVGIHGNPSPNPSGSPSPNPISQDLKTEGGGGSVTEVGTDSPFPLPPVPSPLPPSTPSESTSSRPTTKRPSATGTRATRIPDSFGISAEMRQWAAGEVPGLDIDREHKRFRDFWRGKSGKDATKADWPATWRNWMRRAWDERQPRASPANGRHQARLNDPNANYDEDL
jgi:hypothetical protein